MKSSPLKCQTKIFSLVIFDVILLEIDRKKIYFPEIFHLTSNSPISQR